ncbi:MAG: hypothetical protein AVDCRST_MAG11-2903, partial [uncultured Gemmatimonadaceae bacterium]
RVLARGGGGRGGRAGLGRRRCAVRGGRGARGGGVRPVAAAARRERPRAAPRGAHEPRPAAPPPGALLARTVGRPARARRVRGGARRPAV